MNAVFIGLIMAAVFLFGLGIVDRFGRRLDELRRENRDAFKQEEGLGAFRSERSFH